MPENIVGAFVLTSLAGLSTVIGAFLVFCVRKISARFLSFGLGLSAGVMIYLSFFELLKESGNLFRLAGVESNQMVILMFFVGLVIAGVVDALTHRYMKICPVPNCEVAPMELMSGGGRGRRLHRHGRGRFNKQMLLKTGIFTAIVITIHNFPEGIATFTTASVDLVLGFSIAIAIAIHNIPEGFCVALPIYCATGSKCKSIMYALLAGLAEPIGALLTYLILMPFINNFVMGIMLAIVAGIMVYVALDELLPTARRFGNHTSLIGLIVGMSLMAFSLFLLH